MTHAQILVVEDEGIIARGIRRSLENLGYTVPAIACSGEEAILKVGETHPDLVLMDILLKGDMSGVEAAQRIRTCSNIPVVYLTAYADEDTLEKAKVTEPFGYIIKPFTERELRTAIEMGLHRYEKERSLKEREQWLDTTLKSIGDAVIVTDAHGRVTFMNPTAEALTGWKQEEALGKEVTEIVHVINEETHTVTENPVTKALREGVVAHLAYHTLLIAKDETETPIADSAAPIRDERGNITGVVLVFSDISEHRRAEERLRYLSTHDMLTDLYNRAYFQEEMARLERGRQFPVSVVVADVDGLKATNDREGHAAGDELLRRAAAVLHAAFRAEDVVARIGGDEFAVLLPNADPRAAEEALERVRNSLATHNMARDGRPLTLSMGASTAEMGSLLAEAMKQADERMYQEKRARADQALRGTH